MSINCPRCEDNIPTQGCCAFDDADALDRYRAHVVPQPHVSVAESLLMLWDRPWSSTALRFAYHACHHALVRGLDVMEIVL